MLALQHVQLILGEDSTENIQRSVQTLAPLFFSRVQRWVQWFEVKHTHELLERTAQQEFLFCADLVEHKIYKSTRTQEFEKDASKFLDHAAGSYVFGIHWSNTKENAF